MLGCSLRGSCPQGGVPAALLLLHVASVSNLQVLINSIQEFQPEYTPLVIVESGKESETTPASEEACERLAGGKVKSSANVTLSRSCGAANPLEGLWVELQSN